MKRRSAFLDSQRVIGGGFTVHERQLRRALKRLIAAADHAINESDDSEIWPVCDLSKAASEAERILQPKRK